MTQTTSCCARNSEKLFLAVPLLSLIWRTISTIRPILTALPTSAATSTLAPASPNPTTPPPPPTAPRSRTRPGSFSKFATSWTRQRWELKFSRSMRFGPPRDASSVDTEGEHVHRCWTLRVVGLACFRRQAGTVDGRGKGFARRSERRG